MNKYRYPAKFIGFIVAISLLSACARIAPAPQPTAFDRAKQLANGINSIWNAAQDTFAKAYLDAKITEAQWQQFKALDAKVLASGRVLRDSLRAWEAGATPPSADKLNQQTAAVIRLFDEAVMMAGAFGLKTPQALKEAR
jgi:hypothetical protein